jgi:phenylacetate-coenzyme A ligase PaaK-like adenylate-forming protein
VAGPCPRCRHEVDVSQVTNLYNLVQPLIRLEVTDVVTLDPEPCPCGRSLVRASTIHGRSDDILSLPARHGPAIAIHPLHFALLTRDPQCLSGNRFRVGGVRVGGS